MTTTDAIERDWSIYADVLEERRRQDTRWGERSHPGGTAPRFEAYRDMMRKQCEIEHSSGAGTWASVLLEETYEVLAETDAARLRAELIQLAAVAFAWIADIDKRAGR